MFTGLMPVSGLDIDMIVGAAPFRRAGAAAAVGESAQELGGALGIALIGSLLNAAFRSRMSATTPGHTPPAADTLPAALDAARTLPEPFAGQLAARARDAFAAGPQLTALIAIPIMLGPACLAVSLLRHARPDADPSTDQEHTVDTPTV
ncbi:hypothetical protein ACQEU3_43130 [Spirillospora sp. CA-253888]